MIFDDNLKTAIKNLPTKDKDSLLIRLIKRDKILSKRLFFELVSEDTQDDRRVELEESIKESVITLTNFRYSGSSVLSAMRRMSAQITEHIKITKDKFGDASLNLLVINEILRVFKSNITHSRSTKEYKLCIYVIAKVYRILMSVKDLHEDFQIEFEDTLSLLQTQIADNDYLMKIAINNGLDINWLSPDNIPDNIKLVYKELKTQGFLR